MSRNCYRLTGATAAGRMDVAALLVIVILSAATTGYFLLRIASDTEITSRDDLTTVTQIGILLVRSFQRGAVLRAPLFAEAPATQAAPQNVPDSSVKAPPTNTPSGSAPTSVPVRATDCAP